MTQHHDPVHPDPGDEAVAADTTDAAAPELSVADDAYVGALLADLPQVTMPTDVRDRIDAVLAGLEPYSADGAESAEGAVAATADAEPPLGATVVPLTAARSRWRNPRVLQAAAALVLVVGGIAVVSKFGPGTSTAASTAGGVPAAAPGSDFASGKSTQAASRSGTAYTSANLTSDVQRLVDRRMRGAVTDGAQTSATPPGGSDSQHSLTPTPLAAGEGAAGVPDQIVTPLKLNELATNVDRLAACVAAIEDGSTYTPPVAIDAGSFNNQPALIVVLPDADDASRYAVWIVLPECGETGQPNLISLVFVPRS